ncbi:MAG: nuclear transport factor 2 family protein [Pyrinomonadaceae bacterium]
MLKRLPAIILLIPAFAAPGFAQNANMSSPQTTRERTSTRTTTTTTQTTAQDDTGAQEERTPATGTRAARRRRGAQTGNEANSASAKGVVAAFNALLDGIRRADVNAVTATYWNSPQLVLFNNNGTVTRGWEQMRENRASSYPEMKDVKLEVRDVRTQMLGRDGAVVTCLWTQSQTYRGTPETASGRMTIVFRNTGGAWKAIHLHTSPDRPDPSRLLPSEQTETPATTPAPTPATTPKPKTTP